MTLAALASRPPRPLHPLPPRERRRLTFPGTLQFFHTLTQLIVHLLQPFDLLLLFLNNQQRLGQLFFQFGNALILRIRLRVLPSFSHHSHLTFFYAFRTRAFPPVFFQSSINALFSWLDQHYDPQSWASTFIIGDPADAIQHEPIIGNSYFKFNWHDAALQYGDDPDAAHKALLNEGFMAMGQAVHPVTDPVKAEIVACLQAISDAGNSLDQFVALMWTLKIPHANGMISADYGLGVQVDAVRQHGVDAIYGRTEVECMMNGDYPISIDPRKLAKYA